jgi:hypothetical protein
MSGNGESRRAAGGPTPVIEHTQVPSRQRSFNVTADNFDAQRKVSRPGEFRPQPLAEPYVTVSRHTAPIALPPARPYARQWTNNWGCLLATRHIQ